jgi:hypothetical protein
LFERGPSIFDLRNEAVGRSWEEWVESPETLIDAAVPSGFVGDEHLGKAIGLMPSPEI